MRAAIYAVIAVQRIHSAGGDDSSVDEGIDAEIVRAALEEGSEKLETVRLMVLGGTTRGKTSTIASLRGKEFNPLQESTRGVDLSVYHLVPGQRIADKDLEEILSSKDNFEAKFLSFSRTHRESQRTLVPKNPPSNFVKAALSRPSQGIAADRIRGQRIHTSPHATKLVEDAISSVASSAVSVGGLTLRCWDFGGQREYEVAHELFISPRAILMLVFDLTRFEHADKRDDEVMELNHWLQTIFALTPEKDLSATASSLLIVGTRRDGCNDIEQVPHNLRALRECLFDTLDAGVTKHLAVEHIPILAIENQTAFECPEKSGLTALEQRLYAIARKVINESKEVPLRWLAFVQSLRKFESPGIFLDHAFIEAKNHGFYFPRRDIDRMGELQTLLRYFRDIGELVLYDRSSSHWIQGRPDYVVCLQPERVLRALKVIIAPTDVRCEGLTNRQDRDNMREGLVSVNVLAQKWGSMDGLGNPTQRKTLVELFASMDLFVNLGSDLYGVPSLRPTGWEDWGWMKGGQNTSEIAAVTVFDNYVPFGLIGTLISRLYRTVGESQADVHYVRANAVLLTTGLSDGNSPTQVFTGFDKPRRELHWIVRSDEHDFRALSRCFVEFDAHMAERVRSTLCQYKHVLVAECPRGCAKMGFRLEFPVSTESICKVTSTRKGARARMRSFLNIRPRRPMSTIPNTVARISTACGNAKCANANCQSTCTYGRAILTSETSGTPGNLRQGEPQPYAVFISHAGAHEDKEWAEYLAKQLESKKPSLRTFVDRPELTGSWQTAPEIMEKAMHSARVGVFITSPEFFARRWTMHELRTFLDRSAKGRVTGEKIVIYPIFHRLSFSEASDPNIYQNSKFAQQIVDEGFFDIKRQAECSTKQAVQAMHDLCKFSGLEKKLPAIHEQARSRDEVGYCALQAQRHSGDVEDHDRELQGVTLDEYFNFAAERIAIAYHASRRG